MFLGHFGTGFAAKYVTPRMSLGVLFTGAQFADLLWPTLLVLGVERVRIVPGATTVTPLVFEHYPVSHSLLAISGWALALGLGYLLLTRSRKGAVMHALVHRPDLPLLPGGDSRAGLNAWSSLPLTLGIELAIFGGGVWLYSRATEARDAIGRWGFRGLVFVLLVIYAGNLFGAPPPNIQALAWAGHLQWLFVLWGFWIDRHREAVIRP
jgi:hypothetical protein